MEHNAIQWSGAPSCQRGSYAFYKSVSSRAQPEGPVQVWKLGEFYFIRCGPQDPVCIAEVTLLWEDQTRRHLLASARLYFLPEDTPKGRTREHGEDEVLAVSRKMVVRVEDLVRWSCAEPAGWTDASPKLAPPYGTNGVHKRPHSDVTPVRSDPDPPHSDLPPAHSNPLAPPSVPDPPRRDPPPAHSEPAAKQRSSEPLRDRTPNGVPALRAVKVLSYPQYCRYRSLQRRIQEGARDPGLQDPHLLALGGVKVKSTTRLMYCRDTFSHPTLEGSASFTWQFRCPSLSLRGRPRKRRGRDSRDSPNSIQPESWIERMKENVMGSVEAGCEGSWLPHPDEQLFLDQLMGFMERRGSPIHKVPNLGFKKIDLFLLFSVVKRLGGYKKVTADRLWKVVYNELGGCPGSTSAATCTRRHYERLMLPYEEHLRAAGGTTEGATEFKIPESPIPHRPRGIRGRKPMSRGRKPGPRGREKRGGANVAHANTTRDVDSSVVKRGRGRPPGTRNKSKLLSQQEARSRVGVGVLARGRGGAVPRQIQPAILPINLSPLQSPFLAFPKAKELKSARGESVAPAPTVLLSTLPRHFVGGSLGAFSPIKGVCPLDVFRSRMSLQRGPESPGLTPPDPAQHPPAVYTPQQGGEQPQPQPPPHQHHNHCSGCDEGGQQGGRGDGRARPPLPPLRVLPLNLDCSVQVCQLMRTRRLDSSQLQTFTRRLSEALSQDLSAKPPPCAPASVTPEQPLNLSRRLAAKKPPADGTEQNADQSPPSKRSRPAEDDGGGGGGGGSEETKNQEEPADLSSPSRIRAFLLGLPPFQVKLEEDLNGVRIGKFPEPSRGEGRGGEATEQQAEEEEVVPEQQKEQQDIERTNKVQKCEAVAAAAAAEERAGPADTDTHCF